MINPSHAIGGMGSLNVTHAKNTAKGGTRNSKVETRDTWPARIMASKRPTAITELPITKYAKAQQKAGVQFTTMMPFQHRNGNKPSSPAL